MEQHEKILHIDQLRKRIRGITKDTIQNLEDFYDPTSHSFFYSAKEIGEGIRVEDGTTKVHQSSTSTCAMLLSKLNLLEKVCADTNRLRDTIVNSKWDTADLGEWNAYTTGIVLSALKELQIDSNHEKVQCGLRELIKVIDDGDGGITLTPEHRGTKSAFVTFWAAQAINEHLDAIDQKIEPEDAINKTVAWAKKEVYRQISYFKADGSDLKNIHQLAYAWAICKRFGHQRPLPEEISRLILEILLDGQNEDGVWPRYYPLFNWGKAGSAYVYHFELLMALVWALNDDYYALLPYISNIDRIIRWVETRKIKDSKTGYCGWSITTDPLVRFEPISWATVEVYYVLFKMDKILAHIHRELAFRELVGEGAIGIRQSTKFKDILDMEIITGGNNCSVLKHLEEKLVNPIKAGSTTLRRENDHEVLSVFLFGPPGTSKTSIAKAIAGELEWPLLEIDPSHFAPMGGAGLEARVIEVFFLLEKVFDTVILLDEMDELVRDRNEANTDRIGRLWTTLMLPRLTRLRRLGRSVIVGATNQIDQIDDAAKRQGRFDLVLPVGPPKVELKAREIAKRIGIDEEQVVMWAGKLDGQAKECLQRLLYGEIPVLINAMEGRFSEEKFKFALTVVNQKVYLSQNKNGKDTILDRFKKQCEDYTRMS